MNNPEHRLCRELKEFLDSKAPSRIIDLTHSLEETIPSWYGGCGFQVHPVL